MGNSAGRLVAMARVWRRRNAPMVVFVSRQAKASDDGTPEASRSGWELTVPGIEWVEVGPEDDIVLELTPTLCMGVIKVNAKAPDDDLPRASDGAGLVMVSGA